MFGDLQTKEGRISAGVSEGEVDWQNLLACVRNQVIPLILGVNLSKKLKREFIGEFTLKNILCFMF